jgi:O-antigen/teichoic acid export membrane protein
MGNSRQSVAARVAIGTVSNYAGKVFAAVIAFFLTPFVLHRLGATEFGIWALLVSIASYGSLLDFGIGAALVNYVAGHRAREEWPQARSVLATALWLYLALALAGILLSVAVAYLVTPRLPLTPSHAAQAWWLALLLGSASALSLPCSIPGAALRASSRFEMANLLNTAGAIVSALFTVVILSSGGGLRALAASNIVVTLLMQAPAFWMVRRVCPELKFHPRDARFALVRRLFTFSFWVSTVSFANLFHSRAGEVVIGASLPVRSLAPYALAKRLAETAQSLAGQFSSVLPPLTAELNATGDKRRLRAVWLAASRLSVAMFAPIACALAVFAAPLLRAWAGPQFVAGAPVLILLAAAFLFEIATWPAASVLQAEERYRPVAVASVCTGLAILGLSIRLVPRMGINGAALAIFVPTALESTCFVLPFTLHVLGIRFREYLLAVAVPNAAPSIAACAVFLSIDKWLQPGSMPALGAAAAAGGIVYAAIYFLSSQTAAERWGLLRLAQSVRAFSAGS